MPGVNIGNVGLLYTRYLDGAVETLNHESKARSWVRKDDKWVGDFIEGRIHSRRSTAVGYLEDGGAFPTADQQGYTTYRSTRRFVGGSIQITDGAMATASKGKEVARDVITSEVKGLMTNMLKLENGMFFRDGTGVVSTLGTNATGTTDIDCTDARMLWDQGQYQVYNAALTTNRGTVTINDVESAPDAAGNMQFNLPAGSTMPAGSIATDVLVWNNSVNRAITGLDSLIDDGTVTGVFQAVTIANFPRYTSLVLGNGGTNRDLTPALFRQCLAGLMQKSGSESPSQGLKVCTNAWQAINVEELYEGELRLTPETKVAGLAVASFQSALGRVDIMVDTDALYNRMFFADFSKVYRATQKPLAWRPGSQGIFTPSQTAGVWTATALEICNLYIKERHTSAKITDLREDPATAY